MADLDFGFDDLKMYLGEPYKVNDQITIYTPTIGEIIEFGEKKMYNSISMFTGNPTSYRVQLWDIGIDWNNISDFELFTLLVKNSDIENTKLIFGDVDFASLSPYLRREPDAAEDDPGTLILMNEDQTLEIDELVYLHIREYVRKMFNIYPKVEKAKGKMTKEFIIDEDRMNQRIAERNGDSGQSSFLLPLISSMINHPGFKYKLNELKEVGIVQFMDSVQRLQVYETSIAFLKGMYSGMMDTSKMAKKDKEDALNWLKDLSRK